MADEGVFSEGHCTVASGVEEETCVQILHWESLVFESCLLIKIHKIF